MSEKIVGYGLLVLGLLIICLSIFSVFAVFTGMFEPAQLFNLEGVSVSFDVGKMIGSSLPPEFSSQLPQQEAQKVEPISADLLNGSLNLFFHLFLMGFVMGGGYKIALIGTQLVRTITVKLNYKGQEESGPKR